MRLPGVSACPRRCFRDRSQGGAWFKAALAWTCRDPRKGVARGAFSGTEPQPRALASNLVTSQVRAEVPGPTFLQGPPFELGSCFENYKILWWC